MVIASWTCTYVFHELLPETRSLSPLRRIDGRAGDLYTQAAREYLSGDLGKESMVDASELAGQCYEEASKCSKQAGRKEDASALLDKAIEAYKKNPNRISWAATMAERKATLWLEGRGGAEGTRAAKAFSQAAELYEQADDG